MGKKSILVVFFTILFVAFGISTASATAVLYDWSIDVDGTVYEIFPNIYLPPTMGGEISGVSGFSMSDPGGYGFDVPNAIGSVEVTFNPGTPGLYNIDSFFDVEIDEWDNSYFNESGAVVGSPATGQYGSIDDDFGDIAWIMGWDFTLAAGQWAVVTFNITSTPPSGFYLTQNDPETGTPGIDYSPDQTYYLSSNLSIQGGGTSIPDAGILLLLSTALGGLGVLEIRKRLN